MSFFVRADAPETANQWLLATPYQRGPVWSLKQKQNLIKSLLVGYPTGGITTNRRDHGGWPRGEVYAAVVDGKQRITAIREFVGNEFGVPAEWWEEGEYTQTEGIEWRGQQVPGVYYRDLALPARRGFDLKTILVNEAQLDSVEEEAELYLAVNFGGVEQTELDRSCAEQIAQGGPREL